MPNPEEIQDDVETAELDEDTTSSSEADGIGGEVASQLSNFENSAQRSAQSAGGSDSSALSQLLRSAEGQAFGFGMSEAERSKAIESAGRSLTAMVQGDLPHLRERLQQLGLDTTQIDKKIQAANEQAEKAKPLQDAILNGDINALQNLVKTMKPEELKAATELIQKHFEKSGVGMNIELTNNGQLILSREGADRAVAITANGTDVIGIQNGRYDFNAQFVRENPAQEMRQLGQGALNDFARPWGHKLEGKIIDSIRRPSSGGGGGSGPWENSRPIPAVPSQGGSLRDLLNGSRPESSPQSSLTPSTGDALQNILRRRQ